jgi:16S rRNA processing protein RimM
MARVMIGKIRAPHGILGELKVETFDRGSTSLKKGAVVFLEGESAPRTVKSVRPQRDWHLVMLEGVSSRNDSEKLTGRELSMDRDALPKLPKGEFYIADVVGFSAVTPAGDAIGIVEGAAEGAQILLVIKSPAGKEILVPCVEGIVVEVRPAAREILIDPPEGLLDL